jgi:hypothetical protein
LQPKQEISEKVIARVGEQELMESDVAALVPNSLSSDDSTKYVEKFVLDWVKKQLMIKKAEETIDFNEAKIKNKVLDYQYALMIHEYEQAYIESKISNDVSDEEIRLYYEEKSENFILRENLAKCIYFKFQKNTPNIRRFRRLIKAYPNDSTDLWEFANTFAVKSFGDESIWIKFDEVLMETPLSEVNDKKSFLEKNSLVEVSDDSFVYFIKILQKRLIGETAPLLYIRDNIEEIIINKRKIALKKELERRIYDEAIQSDAFEIFTN